MQLSFHEAVCVLFDTSHARVMNIFLWVSGWSHIKSRRCSGAQGLNRQPAVAHICLCYPGHGGLKSLKKKAAGLLRHKRWRVQVFNPSCRFSSSEMLIPCVIAWAEVWKRSRVNTITGVKAWLRFLQESLVLSRPITSFVGSVNPKYGYVSHIRSCGSFQQNHGDILPRPVMWPIEVAWGTVWVCSVCKGILRLHHPVDVAHLYLSYICFYGLAVGFLLCSFTLPKVTSKGHMMWWSKVLQWFDP